MGVARRFSLPSCAALITASLCAVGTAEAQSQDPLRLTEPTIVVTAQKEPDTGQKLPVSVTAVTGDTLKAQNLTTLSEAAIFAPNTFFSEFQARKLSFPRFRGISAGAPGNPAITTYVDGVPMMHTNLSSLDLVDVEQVEFVRGGQSALFGRNALGGIMNVSSARPSLNKWTGSLSLPFGNFGTVDSRGTVSGPLSSKAAISLSAGRSQRDGYTVNDITGNDLDTRANNFGKAQLLFVPAANWETRVVISGERARDGDYALMDLGSLRTNPFHAQRDFEGNTQRDILSSAFLVRHEGRRVTLSTTTGIVNWDAKDVTDLDYTPFPAATRSNAEKATQFTQEVRLASAAAAPVKLSSHALLRWQAGLFFFTQGYDQTAVNSYAPFVISPQLPVAVEQTTPSAALDDRGVGVYGHGTVTLRQRLDLSFGARLDNEHKDAVLDSFYTPMIAPPTNVTATRSFSNVAPQTSAAFRVTPDRTVYASFGSGYKAGGFNPASPVGAEAYGEEHSWQMESGVKTTWASGRVLANAAFFYINWSDLQLSVSNPQIPNQFYAINVDSARSTGVEFELIGKGSRDLELFGVFGTTNGRFKDGANASGVNLAGNSLPNAPEYTGTFGARYQHALAQYTVLGRGEVQLVGAYQYDDANTAGQEAYALSNFRGGVQRGPLSIEGWVRNAFDTRYIPIVFAFTGGAPSGFIGEMGRPRTFGVSLGVRF